MLVPTRYGEWPMATDARPAPHRTPPPLPAPPGRRRRRADSSTTSARDHPESRQPLSVPPARQVLNGLRPVRTPVCAGAAPSTCSDPGRSVRTVVDWLRLRVVDDSAAGQMPQVVEAAARFHERLGHLKCPSRGRSTVSGSRWTRTDCATWRVRTARSGGAGQASGRRRRDCGGAISRTRSSGASRSRPRPAAEARCQGAGNRMRPGAARANATLAACQACA
jgi:hypothetical protein